LHNGSKVVFNGHDYADTLFKIEYNQAQNGISKENFYGDLQGLYGILSNE
jgi:hypothetical protein